MDTAYELPGDLIPTSDPTMKFMFTTDKHEATNVNDDILET
jgi:hypothetical protein